jgi:outer membrane protein
VPADATSSGSVGIFQLGLRAVYLDPHNPVAPPPPEIDMSGKVYPEIFGEWFLARSWSTELSIGAPTNFSVTNDAGIGIRLTPIILTAKYHLLPGSRVQPYLGAGLHYTQTSLVHVPQSTYPKFPSSTTGFVAQVGVDLRTASSWYVDADIRYVSGLEPGGYKIDPFLYSLGVSYRW